jgi:hypothetical protein
MCTFDHFHAHVVNQMGNHISIGVLLIVKHDKHARSGELKNLDIPTVLFAVPGKTEEKCKISTQKMKKDAIY